MKNLYLIITILIFISCSNQNSQKENQFISNDSLTLLKMVSDREQGMIKRDINTVIQQFDTNATFINGGGFYYEGINEIRKFHESMFNNDSLTYSYIIGEPLINPIENTTALVYYSWQQLWAMKNIKSDTLSEVGLMTIIAVKENNNWKWKSITNQRTKEFFMNLKDHKAKQ